MGRAERNLHVEQYAPRPEREEPHLSARRRQIEERRHTRRAHLLLRRHRLFLRRCGRRRRLRLPVLGVEAELLLAVDDADVLDDPLKAKLAYRRGHLARTQAQRLGDLLRRDADRLLIAEETLKELEYPERLVREVAIHRHRAGGLALHERCVARPIRAHRAMSAPRVIERAARCEIDRLARDAWDVLHGLRRAQERTVEVIRRLEAFPRAILDAAIDDLHRERVRPHEVSGDLRRAPSLASPKRCRNARSSAIARGSDAGENASCGAGRSSSIRASIGSRFSSRGDGSFPLALGGVEVPSHVGVEDEEAPMLDHAPDGLVVDRDAALAQGVVDALGVDRPGSRACLLVPERQHHAGDLLGDLGAAHALRRASLGTGIGEEFVQARDQRPPVFRGKLAARLHPGQVAVATIAAAGRSAALAQARIGDVR